MSLDLQDIVRVLLLACIYTVMFPAIYNELFLSNTLSTVEFDFNNPFLRLLEYIVILWYQLIPNKVRVFLPCILRHTRGA
jgi:hypothetical protein